MNCVLNFSAGPAVLPLPVLEEAQRDLVSLPGLGMSILDSVTARNLEASWQTWKPTCGFFGIPSTHKILFLPGRRLAAVLDGADEPATSGATADYIITGGWAQKALKEAQRVLASTLPRQPGR